MAVKQRLGFIVNGLRQTPIHEWKQRDNLQRLGSKNIVLNKCKKVQTTHLCYYFRNINGILYIGSTTKSYKQCLGRSNFATRISKYYICQAGTANERIFSTIKLHLKKHKVKLGFFRFRSVTIGKMTMHFNDASNDPYVIWMLEQFLISYYRFNQKNVNLWNIK